jgi:hypothetical protein
MNTLWTFGDSFTFGHGCIPDGPTSEYYFNYKKEGDDIWPNHLGKLLNTKIKNFGKCGASNDFIIDSIIDQWDKIKENDFVIISRTYHTRFDIPLKNKLSLSTNFWHQIEDLKNFDNYFESKEKMETVINFQYYFANDELYKKRHLKRYNFLLKLLNEKNIRTFIWDVEYMQYTTRFEKIADATNYEIKDYHFSFKGHKDFTDMVYKKLINPTLI